MYRQNNVCGPPASSTATMMLPTSCAKSPALTESFAFQTVDNLGCLSVEVVSFSLPSLGRPGPSFHFGSGVGFGASGIRGFLAPAVQLLLKLKDKTLK